MGVATAGEWSEHAACRAVDPEELFVEGAAQGKAKAVCAGCVVRTECLAYALDNRIEHGVWGGMTERERRALLRRRPTVTSWRGLLEAARTGHARPGATGDRPQSAEAALACPSTEPGCDPRVYLALKTMQPGAATAPGHPVLTASPNLPRSGHSNR
ncbi:WhiB family transcriptional regulator [Streptomyces sp. NPDC047082]|uniref:WhiB family transcriptional regulator n=1 Tax=Streptomyces sp. NPDC047082 TaxID=3155259 RepID=UPI0033FA459E